MLWLQVLLPLLAVPLGQQSNAVQLDNGTTAAINPSSSRNRGYILIAPKRLIAGETQNVCLSIHNLEPPVNVSLDLLPLSSPKSDEILASVKTHLKSGVETCLELRVAASTKYSMAKLRLRLRFEKYPDYIVETEKKVMIEHDTLVTFVETDKAVYKPGQDVLVRILSLKHDLRPCTSSIPKIWIESPSEVRVSQWTNVSLENGMVQLSFPLSDEPSSGTWKVKVEKSRAHLVQTASFEVKKYVLPRFQVTIGAPGYILADATTASWKICARYSYGEPVKGTLALSLRPQTPVWKRKQPVADIKFQEKMGANSGNDGCTNYTVSGKELGLGQWRLTPSSVVLLANFTEERSGQVETASSRSPVLHQPLRLEFAPHTPKHFKPGLPYHGKLRVLRADASSPAPNEKVQVCLRVRRKDEWQRSVVECRNFSSPDPQGFLDFIVPPQERSVVLLSFVATAVDYPTKYYSPDKRWRVFVDQPSAYVDVEPWYSPSQSYLSVTRANQPMICGEKYSFNVMYTSAGNESEQPVTFHYSINSKGDLLIFGHVKYKPRKDTLLDYSEFSNVLAAGAHRNRGSSASTVHRFPLSVRITASMAPVSELLLYYVRPDGEIVSASFGLELPLADCFENRVKTTWHEDSSQPGSMARFHIEAAAFSLCGISAVDKSTKFLSSSALAGNLLQPEAAFSRLRSFHLQPDSQPLQSTWTHCDKSGSELDENAREGEQEIEEEEEEEIDHLPKPVAAAGAKNLSRARRHSVTYNVDANYVDAVQAFDNFGTVVMSDLILESRPCPLWRSGFGRGAFEPNSQEDDEPDRMLKAVKAMPLAFQFAGSGGTAVVEAASAPGSSDLQYLDPAALEMHATVRSYFPETWIWDLVPTGKDGKTSIDRELPDSITEWIGNTVCVSAKHGLGIGRPVRITAFQPFFLDSHLPYSVKRAEQLRFRVSVFNYMPYSLPVTVTLINHEGLDLAFNGTRELFACVPAKDSFVREFSLVPRLLGDLNVTVAAQVDPRAAPDCEPYLPEDLLLARDELVRAVKVKAEGFPVEVTRSAFLCPKDFSDDSSLVWEIELPPNDQVVEGSARARVALIGDVLGPALENLDRLVKLPMGCGEQNMILFAPNIHVIAYLDAINGLQPGSELRAKALRNMRKGYQRELNYRHADGSYSAFGPGSEGAPGGSMWLTAFVVKSFAQARPLIQIDERDLKLSVKWIVRRQLENGCFPVVGQIFHKDMKGGLRDEGGSSSAALTAYVLVALLESGVPLSATLVNNALYCLEKAGGAAGSEDTGSLYGAALTTYALALLEHPRAEESLRALLTRATRQDDLLWWEDKGRPSLGLSIETTAYGILSMLKISRAGPGEDSGLEVLRAVRWMSKKRNSAGGFSSTQDTVLGLEALGKFALAMANSSASELSVLVTASDVDRLLRVNESNRLLLQRVPLGSLPTSLEVFAEGEGCLLVQSSLVYNKPQASGSEAFDVTASAESVPTASSPESGDRCSVQRLTVCARYKLPDEESNMVVLEVDLPTGFRGDLDSLHDLLQEPATGVKRFEALEDALVIYFDKLTSQKTCISFQAIRDDVVENARPGIVKLYDYYQQELTIFTSYEFVDPCAPTPEPDRQESAAHKVEEPVPAVFRQRSVDPELELPEKSVSPSTVADAAVDNGSGTEPFVEEGFSPAFVNADHELETPDGLEGPVPVYVVAPSSTPLTPSHSSVSTERSGDCPQCREELPSFVGELFCESSRAVKVAVRRFRKARLLLELRSSSIAKRLRATLEMKLGDECSCPALDKPGTMALILSSRDGPDISNLPDKAKVVLGKEISVFTLLPTLGTPDEIREALLNCPRRP